MPAFNKCTFVGNITRDPEIRYVEGGAKAVTKFGIAINRKTKNGQDEVMYLTIVAWERIGEICNQYLSKGMLVLVDGRLSIRNYDDRDGNKKQAVELVLSEMQMLESRNMQGERTARAGRAPVSDSQTSRSTAVNDFGEDDDGEEIPF